MSAGAAERASWARIIAPPPPPRSATAYPRAQGDAPPPAVARLASLSPALPVRTSRSPRFGIERSICQDRPAGGRGISSRAANEHRRDVLLKKQAWRQ